MLVILTAMTNFVLVLIAPGAHDLSELNRQTAEFNGTQVTNGWYFFWPGMLYIWGAAWLAFLAFAVKKNLRGALAAFLLTTALWFLPMALFVVSLIVGA